MTKTPHEALHRIFQEDATLFARAFERILGVAFPRPKTVLMTTIPYPNLTGPLRRQWQEEGREKGLQEGRIQEATAAVLQVLWTRGLTVSATVESRIRGCTDLTAAETMLTRAVTATRAEDLFDS